MLFWCYLMNEATCQNARCNGRARINFEQKTRKIKIKLNFAIYIIYKNTTFYIHNNIKYYIYIYIYIYLHSIYKYT